MKIKSKQRAQQRMNFTQNNNENEIDKNKSFEILSTFKNGNNKVVNEDS